MRESAPPPTPDVSASLTALAGGPSCSMLWLRTAAGVSSRLRAHRSADPPMPCFRLAGVARVVVVDGLSAAPDQRAAGLSVGQSAA